jgi:hypothetical protein
MVKRGPYLRLKHYNLTIVGDLVRQTIMSRMDAECERPEIPGPIGAGSPQGEAHQVIKPRALRD